MCGARAPRGHCPPGAAFAVSKIRRTQSMVMIDLAPAAWARRGTQSRSPGEPVSNPWVCVQGGLDRNTLRELVSGGNRKPAIWWNSNLNQGPCDGR